MVCKLTYSSAWLIVHHYVYFSSSHEMHRINIITLVQDLVTRQMMMAMHLL